METIVGIDLGTTNCSITAIDEDGKTRLIKNRHGEYITPSAVYFGKKKNDLLVGKEAKKMSHTDPENLVLFVKREMGKKKEKVRGENRGSAPYHPYTFWNKTFSPEEISALILKQLKNDAEKELGCAVKKAVITCPAYFGDAEKNATKIAGEIAGFEVLEVIPEPTAASLSYAALSDKRETVLVFDLGGGTFDVTILKIDNSDNGRTVNMLATDGNHKLGGKDWDDFIMDHVEDKFNRKYNIQLMYEPKTQTAVTYGNLRIEVEKAKVALFKEGVEQVPVAIEYGGKKHLETISRSLYAQKTERLTNQCKTYCEVVLTNVGMSWKDIDTVLMIGNMSNCTTIQDALKEWSGKEINFGLVNPKTSVSEGAAIKGYILEGGRNTFVLKDQNTHAADFEQSDEQKIETAKRLEAGERTGQKFDSEIKSVLSASVGILAKKKDGTPFVHKMLKKNSTYPAAKKQIFRALSDKAETQSINVYEGESDRSDECTLLGSAELHLDGKLNQGDPIEITLSKDRNGILQVEAVNQKSGIHIKSEIKRENTFSAADIQQAAEEIEELWI